MLFLIFFSLHLFTLFLECRLSKAFPCEPVVLTFTQDVANILGSPLLGRESQLRFPTLGRNETLTPVHLCLAHPSVFWLPLWSSSSLSCYFFQVTRWFFKHYISIFRCILWDTWHHYWKWKFSFLFICYMIIFTTLRNENVM